jgi:hypothetical protein
MPNAVDLEGRQMEGRCQRPVAVAEQREGDVLAGRELALLVRRLCADADHGSVERGELDERITKGTALRRAASGARDVVPAGRRRLPRNPRARVDVGDEPLLRHRSQVDGSAQMIRRPVILRDRQIGR